MGRFRYQRRSSVRVPPGTVVVAVAAVAFAGMTGTHGGGTAAAHAAHMAHLADSRNGTVAASAGAATAISYARAQLGKPYVYGATGPDAFDCSGLVQAAWSAAGVSIPRTSEDQWAGLPHITADQLKPGDLVFYAGDPIDPPPGHVVMYIGNGLIIEAYGTGVPVRITALRSGEYGYARPGGAS